MRIDIKEKGDVYNRDCWQRLANDDEVIHVGEFAVGVLAQSVKGVGNAYIILSFNDGDFNFALPPDIDSLKKFVESIVVAMVQMPKAKQLAELGVLQDLVEGNCVVVPVEKEGLN